MLLSYQQPGIVLATSRVRQVQRSSLSREQDRTNMCRYSAKQPMQHVMSVYDLGESTAKCLYLEGLVLPRYVLSEKITASGTKARPTYNVINCDLIVINYDLTDCDDLTATCWGEQLCRKVPAYLLVGNYIRMYDFSLRHRSEHDKGDILKSIRITDPTIISRIDVFIPPPILIVFQLTLLLHQRT